MNYKNLYWLRFKLDPAADLPKTWTAHPTPPAEKLDQFSFQII